jgi:hypothetical protein
MLSSACQFAATVPDWQESGRLMRIVFQAAISVAPRSRVLQGDPAADLFLQKNGQADRTGCCRQAIDTAPGDDEWFRFLLFGNYWASEISGLVNCRVNIASVWLSG